MILLCAGYIWMAHSLLVMNIWCCIDDTLEH